MLDFCFWENRENRFTRRRSLVLVQQSPPKAPEILMNFRCFYLFLAPFYDFDIFPHYPFSPDHRDAADRKTPAFAGVLFLPSCCACCFPKVKTAQQRANFTNAQGSRFSLFLWYSNCENKYLQRPSVLERRFGTKGLWTTRQKRRDGI